MTEVKEAEGEQLPVETVDRIILHQKKELLIKEKEIDLGFQQDKHQFEYAKEALAAQERDREKSREQQARFQRRRMWFSFGVAFISLGFLGYLVSIGEKQTAKEIITLVATIAGVGLGGFYWGKSKQDD